MAKDFSMTLLVDESPKEVFTAVLNVRGWWQGFYAEEIKGETKKLHDEFSFRAGDGAHYTRQKLVEVIPNEKVVWLVTHSELTFIEKPEEWEGTKLIFEIAFKGNKTQLRFKHQGLTPEIECYDACSSAWTMYIEQQLLALINRSKSHSTAIR
jgi:hypothetical protein